MNFVMIMVKGGGFMEKYKKILKDFYIFGIVAVCFLGLYAYRLAVKADITTISETKLVQKIESDESFVVVTSAVSSNLTTSYQQVLEKYLTKNRSQKIYFVDLDKIDDADTFVSTYLNEKTADMENPNTYVFVNGEIFKSKDEMIGYYELDQLMTEFNSVK